MTRDDFIRSSWAFRRALDKTKERKQRNSNRNDVTVHAQSPEPVESCNEYDEEDVTDFPLLRWEIVGVKEEEVEGTLSYYLKHDPILVVSRRVKDGSKKCDEGPNEEGSLNDSGECFGLEDRSIEIDPSIAVTIPTSSRHDHPSSSRSPSGGQSSSRERLLEWRLSVVFSETWGAPVLYFQVSELSGEPVSRSDLLDEILQITEEEVGGDSWDFVSHEEHPFTGVPSYFLHPCQTNARLAQLFFGGDDGSSGSQEGRRTLDNGGNLILSWLSMVLPALGFRIRPVHFAQLQKELSNSP